MTWYADIGLYIWEMFKHWNYTLYVVPFKTVDMLWILVPVWIAWFFAEFFQEKTGTSMGNAITNAVVVIWASIDCSRQTFRLIHSGDLGGFWPLVERFSLLALLLIYGIVIIVYGLKGNRIIKKLGRIREITYVFAMLVPIFYNEIELTWMHIISAIVFFPLFYWVIEFIDRKMPDPKAVLEDKEDNAKSSGGNFGSGFGTSSASTNQDSFIGSSNDDFIMGSGAQKGKGFGQKKGGDDSFSGNDFKF